MREKPSYRSRIPHTIIGLHHTPTPDPCKMGNNIYSPNPSVKIRTAGNTFNVIVLRGFKHEIFGASVLMQSKPVWVGDFDG
jgi:hypothetical protein